MTQQELESLSREELIEIVLRQNLELEFLRMELIQEKPAPEDEPDVSAAAVSPVDEGEALAQVRARMDRIFDEAEEAVTQYKKKVERMDADLEAAKQFKLAETEREAEKILAAAQQTAEAATAEAETIKARAKQEADVYWSEASQKLQSFLDAHAGLREMLGLNKEANDG